MSKIFLIFLFCASEIVQAEKCSYVFDAKNVFKTVQCLNVASMRGIADEIRENWTSIEIVNRGANAHFAINPGNQIGRK